MASINSIDTVYRSDSIDIVEYNPRPSETLNPILNRNYDIENNENPNPNQNPNQIRSILLNEQKNKNKNKNRLPDCFYFIAMVLTSFFVSVVIVLLLDFLHIIN